MSTPADEKRTCVLVVDDDKSLRLIARRLFENQGMRVLEAEDGATALRMAPESRPDIICLDVQMPGLDGFATCERLRALPATRHTPVLMMTGLDDEGSIDRAYEAGATDFVVKPVSWPILGHRVRYLLRSSRRAAELWQSQQRLADAQRIARIGNWELEVPGEELRCWGELLELFGLSASGTLHLDALIERAHVDDQALLRDCLESCRSEAKPASTDVRVSTPEGERVLHMAVDAVLDEDGEVVGLRGTSQDVTERKRVEEEARHLAYHDGLTGLPNRRLFGELLSLALHQARRGDRKIGVLFLDLDNFKRINDTLGHGIGDELLEGVSDRLLESVRGGDCVSRSVARGTAVPVARLGGDEFIILLTQVNEVRDLAGVARRVLKRLAEPFQLGGHEVVVTASIGISVWPDDAEDADTLIRNADLAMYRVKEESKSGYRFYTQSMNSDAVRNLLMETHLRRAVAAERLTLHYQPIIDASSGELASMEALARWEDPDLGVIGPDEFIPLAEEAGLIESIGAWVLKTACGQVADWREQGLHVPKLAVNLSGHQFHSDELSRTVWRALAESGLEPTDLDLEITESTLISNRQRVVELLKEFRDGGIQIALDDFGTGYSSLSYLREFPVDTVKIDRMFLRDIVEDDGARRLVAAIVSMSKALGLRSVAEGVETRAQLDVLRSLGCDQCQGYLISRPLPAEAFEEFVRSSGERPAY